MKNSSGRKERFLPKLLWLGLLAVALGGLPGLARAQTPSTTTVSSVFSVMLDVTGGCTIASNSSQLSFPQTQMLTQNETGTLSISVTCSPGVAYTVGIKAGSVGTVTSRLMSLVLNASGKKVASGGTTIPYGLYQDAAYTIPWGDTPSTEESGTGNGSAQTLTVYAEVPAASTLPAAGTYGDYLPIIVTY